MNKSRRCIPALLCTGLLSVVQPMCARAEYVLQPGDVLETSVATAAELRQRSTVNADGVISLPLVGVVNVSGLSLATASERVKAAYRNRSIRQRTSEGREVVTQIYPDEVTVVVADYRPVYVNGDVSKPGELAFRPRLTIRQAVALAGGLDLTHFRTQDPYITLSDLRAEREIQREELVRQEVTLSRIKAEMAGAAHFALPDIAKLASDPSTLGLIQMQREQFRLNMENHRRDRAAAGTMLAQSQSQTVILGQYLQRVKQSTEQQEALISRLKGSVRNGSVPTNRFLDQQRELGLAQDRVLQGESQFTQAARTTEELRRQVDKVDEQWLGDLLAKAQEAAARIADTKARLLATEEKLRYAAATRSEIAKGMNGQPRFILFRADQQQSTAGSPASADTILSPGDVVEVELVGMDGARRVAASE